MSSEMTRNVKVGLFVAAGTFFLILAMYIIGSKQNLFGGTFHLGARFKDVNGLMSGNNVRLAGIVVGTVEKVTIINDSTVDVVMVVKNNIRQHIRKNAIASIGTDGLMGNKLVNILPGKGAADPVDEGDVLMAEHKTETKDMINTLSSTNDNVKVITDNLKAITNRLMSSKALWNLLEDPALTENINAAMVKVKLAGENAAIVTGDLTTLVKDVKAGKGSLGALLTDNSLTNKLDKTLVDVNVLSDRLAVVSGDLSTISGQIKSGQGTVGTLIMDTTFARELTQTLGNLKEGTQGFSDNMEALKHSFLLRKYFRKQAAKKD